MDKIPITNEMLEITLKFFLNKDFRDNLIQQLETTKENLDKMLKEKEKKEKDKKNEIK